jgi:chemotaxis protein methyltransferase CheR
VLRYFAVHNSYKIELINKIEEGDLDRLKILLSHPVDLYEIHFQNLYSLPPECIEILYTYKVEYKKRIDLFFNKSKLSKYLYKLGFQTHFNFEVPFVNLDKEVLVIGGSSNSSEKIIKILSQIDTRAFIIFIVQHISCRLKMNFDRVLDSYVKSDVVYARDGMQISKGNIYIAPADKHLRVVEGKLVLDSSALINAARPSISVTFNSLAQEYGKTLLALLSCGFESDGVDALATLKRTDSLSIVQDPTECQADAMPLNAKQRGIYDYILKTDEIIEFINIVTRKFDSRSEAVAYLLERVDRVYEYNFTGYSRDSILRRIEYFMVKYKIEDISILLVLVLFNVSMFKALFLELSINVTEFFRKELSSKNMIKLIQKEHKNCYNIKIWSAGCSTGQEVYSTAIILNELGLLDKSIIYATDFNPVVIEEAKSAIYARKVYDNALSHYDKLAFLTPLDHYFSINEQYVRVKAFIRERVHFFVHNLEKDTAFNEFDIIECKNVLIYFNNELTQKVFTLFYNSLKFGGHLLIGESEEIPKVFKNKFEKCNDDCKIYRKIA